MLKQSHQQKLLQKLSPQQIQLMKLLQIPTASLEERIKEEMEENPALEYSSEGDHEQDQYDLSDDGDYQDDDQPDAELSTESVDNVDLDDFLRMEDDDSGKYNYDDSSGGSEERQTAPVRVETSFHEYLLDQLRMLELDERQHKIAEQIIGSMDEDGYLRREVVALVDDLAFSQNVYTSVEEINELIEKIQQFDPPGICVWTLQECLILQLKRIEPQTKEIANAIAVIDKYFNEFIRKHYDKIQRHLGLEDDAFRDVINCIIKLNPKPGAAFAVVNNAENYVLPDFFVYNNNGILELTLNGRNAPELKVSDGYREMMKAYDRSEKKDKRQKEALLFIKQKLDAAKWFIDAIKQRQHTLLHTMHAIIDFQREFFLTGDETMLKPMILKDIALITALDVSTVSRVANSKYVQTEFGTYLLKYFFSESLQTESGEEVSTREVKSILMDMVSSEDKRHPLSDERLTEMLLEKGYSIARRTVAKYREQLNVPVARLRKQL